MKCLQNITQIYTNLFIFVRFEKGLKDLFNERSLSNPVTCRATLYTELTLINRNIRRAFTERIIIFFIRLLYNSIFLCKFAEKSNIDMHSLG